MGYTVPDMERSLRHLQEMAIFAKVGELASISAAARALGLPKSTVSRAVAKLEAGFSARLVERTTRKLALTEIGRAFHEHCLSLVAEAENAEAEVAAYQGTPSGLLRIASPNMIGRHIVGPFLAEFLDRYPEVDLQMQLTDRLLNPVSDGFDVVIRSGWLEDSGVIARKITDIGIILVASRRYIAAHGLPATIEELADHAVIGFPLEGAPALELVSGKERVKVPVWRRFACNDPLLNLQFVRRGLAIAPMSAFFAAEELRGGEIVPVLPEWRLHDPPALYALYAGRTALSPKVGVFLEFLSDLARRLTADPTLIKV
jgi:DNA-binding transcriptional LysR family regulator